MGADQTLNIIIKARDEASATLNKFKGSVEDMKPAFEKMAAVGTVAFAGLSAIAVTSLSAFADSQKEMLIATQSLNNALSGMSSQAVAALNKSLPGTGTAMDKLKKVMDDTGKSAIALGFDDEEASKSFAKLFQTTNDVTQAQSDLTLAMNLSDFSGKSLAESVDAVVKIHAGGTRILKDFGIEVADGTTAMDALALVNAKVGGTTTSMLGSVSKATDTLKIQFQNLKESIGAALAPAFTQAVTALQPLLDKFTAWATANPELLSKIILIGGAVAALVAVVGFLGLVLPAVITGFLLLISPIGIIIALFVTAAVVILTQWKNIKIGLDAVWEGIKNGFKAAINFLIGLAEGFANGWVNAVNFIIRALNKIQFSIPSWVPGIGGKSFGINIPLMEAVSLPRLAEGGIVNSPTVAMIGEAGPEAVVPLKKGGMFGNSINVTINNPEFRGPEDESRMRRMLDDYFRPILVNNKIA